MQVVHGPSFSSHFSSCSSLFRSGFYFTFIVGLSWFVGEWEIGVLYFSIEDGRGFNLCISLYFLISLLFFAWLIWQLRRSSFSGERIEMASKNHSPCGSRKRRLIMGCRSPNESSEKWCKQLWLVTGKMWLKWRTGKTITSRRCVIGGKEILATKWCHSSECWSAKLS